METSIIGKSINRVDALAKVKGEALYPGDFSRPNQLFMKVRFSDRPHAIIKRVDTSQAEKSKGVIAIYTAKDVPINEYGLMVPDQPVLCGPGSLKPYADHVRFIGDQIALVIAETEEQAEEGCKKIEIEYEDLPIITDTQTAMDTNTLCIHPDEKSNIFCHYKIRKGDVTVGFKQSDIIIESDYETPVQEHAYLQPEAGLAYIDDEDRITVIVGGQWVHEDQEQIAHALNLPKEKIRVIYPAIGGAFGGREDMSVQIILALAVYRLHQKGINRPIKIVWTRDESIIGHHKRHPFRIHSKWGATREGKIVAVEIELIADGGAYIYTSTKVLGNATVLANGPYEIPNVKVDSFAVYTNNLPTGAFRGFGGPQACFAAEMQMDKLAAALKIDPVELRMRNLITEGALTAMQTPLPSGISIREVLEKCALASGWDKTDKGWSFIKPKREGLPSHLLQGKGIAIGYKNIGFSFGAPEQCWATIELHGKTEIEKAIIHHAGADVGQGAHSVFAQIAANALGISIEKIELVVSDTAHTENSGSASASRMTFMSGNSILGAAKLVLEKWLNEERPAIASYQYIPPQTTMFDPETGKSMPNFAYGYSADAVEVEVNRLTGKVKISKAICADDVGRAINPLQVQGQIEGAIVQASGYVTLERFIQENGKVLTKSFSTYLIPTIKDIPDSIESLIVETPDPNGPLGARGMGEMPYLCFAPAVVSAIHQATGHWFDCFPLVEEVVLKGLGEL
jgi:CO/xanthine dehydrogenase Mo-binding subunit